MSDAEKSESTGGDVVLAVGTRNKILTSNAMLWLALILTLSVVKWIAGFASDPASLPYPLTTLGPVLLFGWGSHLILNKSLRELPGQ